MYFVNFYVVSALFDLCLCYVDVLTFLLLLICDRACDNQPHEHKISEFLSLLYRKLIAINTNRTRYTNFELCYKPSCMQHFFLVFAVICIAMQILFSSNFMHPSN